MIGHLTPPAAVGVVHGAHSLPTSRIRSSSSAKFYLNFARFQFVRSCQVFSFPWFARRRLHVLYSLQEWFGVIFCYYHFFLPYQTFLLSDWHGITSWCFHYAALKEAGAEGTASAAEVGFEKRSGRLGEQQLKNSNKCISLQ